MLTFLNCASPNIYISQSVDATSKRKSFSELKVAIRLRLGCALSPYKCSCYKRVNWAVSLFSLSGSPFSKLTHIYLYKNIFTFSLEAMKQLFFFAFLFRLFPLRDQYFRFVVVVVVFFFFARQENDEARRRGKYKIKL